MVVQILRYPSATGVGDIYAELWQPDMEPWIVVQIAHGMAEHVGRYAHFAKYLTDHGVYVVMHDHAGHGKSFEEENHKGYFGHAGGRTALIQDMKELRDRVAAQHPELPYVLMGHSMGSLLARAYAAFHTKDIDALILSGTAGRNLAVGPGKVIARLELLRNGPRKPSLFLHKLSFGAYNKAFKPNRTESDWLSRDAAQVNRYVNDPLCGFPFTAEGMRDLFRVMGEVSSRRWAKKVPEVPILMFSGDKDPVGKQGRGVLQVYRWLQGTGHSVSLMLYPGARHEMLNETNRMDAYHEVYAFLMKNFQL